MIKHFNHKGLREFFETGTKRGIQPKHADRLQEQLTALDAASKPEHMAFPGYKFHPLTGNLAGQFAVTVNANWRLTFKFEDGDAVLVDYQDYHGK